MPLQCKADTDYKAQYDAHCSIIIVPHCRANIISLQLQYSTHYGDISVGEVLCANICRGYTMLSYCDDSARYNGNATPECPLHSYGRCSHGMYSYGLCSAVTTVMRHQNAHYIVMADAVMAYIVMAYVVPLQR